MEEHINKLGDDVMQQEDVVENLATKLREYDMEANQNKAGIRSELYRRYNKLNEELSEAKFKMGDYRLKISERETNLL